MLRPAMATLFPRWSDTAFRAGLAGLAVAIPGVFALPIIYVRTPYNLDRHFPVEQPVQFDHRHHAGDDQIACLYCHSGAERTPMAGLPATEICMGCHSQVWNHSAMLEPVRRSFFSGAPIVWNRVNRVPDFVYFNHAVHVTAGGIGCVECHGDVASQPLVERERLFTMGWCLDCHRARGASTATLAPPGSDGAATGERLPPPAIGAKVALASQAQLTTCTTCHR
jgi:Cytochrome c7 and related cytochrome c